MPVQRSDQDHPAASSTGRTARNGHPGAVPDPAATPTSGPAPGPASVRPAPRPPVRRTRAGAAWVGITVGALVLVLLIVFMLQNTAPVDVHFFGLTGSAPLALTLLIAAVGAGIVALVVGTVRITQLRRRIGADRRSATGDDAPPA